MEVVSGDLTEIPFGCWSPHPQAGLEVFARDLALDGVKDLADEDALNVADLDREQRAAVFDLDEQLRYGAGWWPSRRATRCTTAALAFD